MISKGEPYDGSDEEAAEGDTRLDNIKRETAFYNLDAIISVGYRVNSSRASDGIGLEPNYIEFAELTIHETELMEKIHKFL